MVYDYSGVITGQQTVASTVGNVTTFEGSSAREVTATTTGSNSIAGISTAIDTEVKAYQTAAANGEVTQYGSIARATTPIAGFSLTNTIKTVYTPAWVDRMFTMTAGQTLVQTYAGTTTTTTGGIAGVPGTTTTSNLSASQTTRYLGRESVTVPAGTFNACKFEQFDTASPSNVTTSWLAPGNGVMVKTTGTSTQGPQTISARTLLINGAAVTN